MKSAQDALDRLRNGNRRFLSGEASPLNRMFHSDTRRLSAGQSPFAVILGCSDSRVPLEILFDQGPGDLFVVRIAGAILAPSIVGSIEFATEQFNCPLVVILGHSECGAVQMVVDHMDRAPDTESPNLLPIVKRIRPKVEELRQSTDITDPATFLNEAIRAHVRASVQSLPEMSAILERRIRDDKLRVVGAEYDLKTGIVDFFEESAERL